MNTLLTVLVIGTGGREHALAWKIAQSKMLRKLYVAPGNAGTSDVAENVPIPAGDIPALLEFARTHDVDLTVVGPDDTLAQGIVDSFQAAGMHIFGPTQAAAQIEASKAFSKDLMDTAHVPTARFATFTSIQPALDYISDHEYPLVVKASGLALGKGVTICADVEQARAALHAAMEEKVFGAAGSSVVIEDFLSGREISIHALSDGHTSVLFPSAQDHKAAFDNDLGPNTGGMGTIAPVPWAGPELIAQARSTVVEPILRALSQAGAQFSGLLYPGLMVDSSGQIKVLEFNARFGDPETQSYMRLLSSDLLEVLFACAQGDLSQTTVTFSDQVAVTVVLASGGYPNSYKKGLPVTGIAAAQAQPDIVVFHAGTKLSDDGQVLTNGGRVLGVSATGSDLATARAKAYAAAALIDFEGKQFRTDIGSKSLTS